MYLFSINKKNPYLYQLFLLQYSYRFSANLKPLHANLAHYRWRLQPISRWSTRNLHTLILDIQWFQADLCCFIINYEILRFWEIYRVCQMILRFFADLCWRWARDCTFNYLLLSFCQWLGRQVKTDPKTQQGSLFGNKRTVLHQIYKWLRH